MKGMQRLTFHSVEIVEPIDVEQVVYEIDRLGMSVSKMHSQTVMKEHTISSTEFQA